MAKQNPFTTTLVDRLLGVKSPLTLLNGTDHNTALLHENIRVHIENLLNAKKCLVSWEKKFTFMEDSILNYGVDDFMSLSMDSLEAIDGLCHRIKNTIELFIKQLTNVQVTVIKDCISQNRTLALTIEANLLLTNMPLVFISKFNGHKNCFSIHSDNGSE